MTTLHLTRFYHPHIGGVEKHVASVLHNLPTQKWRKIVMTLRHDDKLADYEVIDNVEVYRLGLDHDKDKFKTWIAVCQLWKLFGQADVIHVHDVFWWLLPLYLFVSHKVYVTFHGWEGQYPVPWSSKLQRLIYSQLAQARIHIGQYIQEFYWDRPNLVLYGGANKSKLRKIKKINVKKINIVFLGRLTAENEISGYCQLLKKLRDGKINYQMTWVGDGPWAKECKKYGVVTGLVANPDKYLIDADLVLASSYLAMWEAQSMGKIVIGLATHRLKRRYIETYPGFQSIIYSPDPDILAEKIFGLIQDSASMTNIQSESIKIADRYTWAKVSRQYLQLWQTR